MGKKHYSKPLPLWSKALIVLVAFGMFGGLVSTIFVTAAIKYQVDYAQDPKYIAQVASRMVKLPNPLPEGYTYMLGADLWLAQVVSIDYKNNTQRLVFVACPTDLNSQQMLTNAYEKGIITSESSQTQFTDVLSEGGWLIQDTQIPYRVGKLAGNNAGVGLVACVSDQQQGRALILYALQPKGDTFDMKVCTNLLQGIPAF